MADEKTISHLPLAARGWERDEPTQLIKKVCDEGRKTALEAEQIIEAGVSARRRSQQRLNQLLDKLLGEPKPA